jgi:hypothetical protein
VYVPSGTSLFKIGLEVAFILLRSYVRRGIKNDKLENNNLTHTSLENKRVSVRILMPTRLVSTILILYIESYSFVHGFHHTQLCVLLLLDSCCGVAICRLKLA